MSQPNDKPISKQADELTVGDHIHDGRGIGPVEITHVQAHRNAHGDERVLIVTGDAAVSYHPVDELFTMATDAEVATIRQAAAARRAAEVRPQQIAKLRTFADWLEDHPDLPMPYVYRMQAGVNGEWEDRVAAVKRLAASVGVEPTFAEDDTQVTAQFEVRVPDSFTYLLYTTRQKTAEEQQKPHYESGGWKGPNGGCGVQCVCGETYDGFDSLAAASELLSKHIKEGNAAAVAMLETPLDELPADFGEPHDPGACECEDCEDVMAAAGAEPVDGPVYADSVNGEEL